MTLARRPSASSWPDAPPLDGSGGMAANGKGALHPMRPTIYLYDALARLPRR